MTIHMPLGMIVAYAINNANIPAGWLPCNGSAIPDAYQDLITLLGSNTTPDLRGRTIIGAGTPLNNKQSDESVPNFPSSAFVLGSNGGEYSHTLTGSEVPPHTHVLANQVFTESGSSDPFIIPPSSTNEPTYDTTSAASSHNNMQPYYVVNYIIYAVDASKVR
ncbi:phage tail protein [Undibacterium sp. SXout11W]|uniref:phage tail protein n=1 Tax=Undibacterium sp. SXout11W TaxID=3413050 RepID=UPI003BF38489